jgi:hypothetical protein
MSIGSHLAAPRTPTVASAGWQPGPQGRDPPRFRAQGAGLAVHASGFRIWSLGFRVKGERLGVQGLGFGGKGFRFQGSGLTGKSLGFRV